MTGQKIFATYFTLGDGLEGRMKRYIIRLHPRNTELNLKIKLGLHAISMSVNNNTIFHYI